MFLKKVRNYLHETRVLDRLIARAAIDLNSKTRTTGKETKIKRNRNCWTKCIQSSSIFCIRNGLLWQCFILRDYLVRLTAALV